MARKKKRGLSAWEKDYIRRSRFSVGSVGIVTGSIFAVSSAPLAVGIAAGGFVAGDVGARLFVKGRRYLKKKKMRRR